MELQPGLITGPLSSIFKELVYHLVQEFEYDTNSMVAAAVSFFRIDSFQVRFSSSSFEIGRKRQIL